MVGVVESVLVALAGALGSIILFLVKDHSRKNDITTKNVEAIKKNQESLEKFAEILDTMTVELNRHGEGMKILMRWNMEDKYRRIKRQGYVTNHELRDFEESYNLYHIEGGNGIATRWHEEILQMEIKED